MKFGNTNILIIFVKLTNGMQEMKRHIFCACTLAVILKTTPNRQKVKKNQDLYNK